MSKADAWWLPYLGEPVTDREHCWYWFSRIQAEVFGRGDLPDFSHVSARDSEQVSALFLRHPERRRWVKRLAPQDGDAVYLQYGDEPLHIGVYVSQPCGVVHAAPGALGVALTERRTLVQYGIQRMIYYRYKGDDQ